MCVVLPDVQLTFFRMDLGVFVVLVLVLVIVAVAVVVMDVIVSACWVW